MRHRASRNLLAPLRRLRPRRRAAAAALTRPSLRLVCAVASALAVLTGAMVAASELGDDSVPTGDPGAYADRSGAAEPSRAAARTAWPTADAGTPSTPPTPEAKSSSAPVRDTRAAQPTTSNDAEERASRHRAALTLPSAKVSATVETPDVSAAVPTRESGSSSSGDSSTDGSTTDRTTATPDNTPPQTTIVSGPSLTDTSGVKQESEFVFDADESATFSCSLDGAPFQPCDSPQEYDNVTPGRHEFAVRAIDAAGNVDPTPDRSSWIATGLGQ